MLVLTSIFFGISPHLWSQSSTADSLIQVARGLKQQQNLNEAITNYFQASTLLEREGNSVALGRVYQEIGSVYTEVGLHEKAAEYYELSAENAPKMVSNIEDLAEAYFYLKEFGRSIEIYSQALGLRLQTGNRQAALPIMERLVVCFHELGSYEQALDNEKAVLEMSQALGDSADITTSYNNLGYDYNFVGDYEQALIYLKKALEGKRRIGAKQEVIVPIMLNIAVVHQNQQEYEEAIQVLLDAVVQAENSNNKKLIARVYLLVSEVYFNEGDYYNAEVYNQQLLQLLQESYQPALMSQAYLTASRIYQKVDEYEDAFNAYERHLELRDSIRVSERLAQQSLLQQQVAYERAEREIKLIMAEKERLDLEAEQQELRLVQQQQEIKSLGKQKALQEAKLKQQELEQVQAIQEQRLLQQQLAGQQQQQRFNALKQQEELQRIKLEQKEAEDKERQAKIQRLEIENRLKEEQTNRERESAKNQQRFFLTLGMLGLLVVILALWGFFSTKKKNQELAIQQILIQERNAELSQMNEEVAAQRDAVGAASEQLNIAYSQITDSVRYAQRIQQSILIPPKEIIPHFKDGFILFLPRDIVSGDFYWFSQKEGKTIITAVDCTGHGVPGAFMSLIGNDLLNDIVNLRNITEPGIILEELSEGVRRTLKQDQNDNQDGMDMGLCVIDHEKKEVHFAGAKNPIVYVQHGEVHQIKGSKMAIGGRRLYKDKTYETHVIPIDSPTCFYLFSDGYQDQFGGPKNKKFMAKRLRGLLHELHELPMKEQQAKLHQTLNEWKGKEQQLDDILLMGFKV